MCQYEVRQSSLTAALRNRSAIGSVYDRGQSGLNARGHGGNTDHRGGEIVVINRGPGCLGKLKRSAEQTIQVGRHRS